MVEHIKHFLRLTVIFMILALLLESCRTAEKAGLSCPEFSVNKTSNKIVDHKTERNKSKTAHYKAKIRNQPKGLLFVKTGKNQGKDLVKFKNSPVTAKVKVPGVEYLNDLSKIEFLNELTASNTNTIISSSINDPAFHPLKKVDISVQHDDLHSIQPSLCDTVFLKSGSWMIVKIVEIGRNKIIYRSCDSLNGPATSISKSEVSRVKSPVANHRYFTEVIPAYTDYTNAKRVTEPLGITAFVSTLTGLFSYLPLFSIIHPLIFYILIPLGLILGGISNSITKKQPGKFKGRGFAKFSIFVGISVIITIIVSLMLLMIVGF
jgi:hypothetical protein